MPNDGYYGAYVKFITTSKSEGAALVGADNLVGDIFTIEFVTEEGQRVAWLKNKFGALVGFFDSDVSRELSLCEAHGWTLQALLTLVAYDDSPPPGVYWGEAALICYDPTHKEAFESFTEKVSTRLIEGIRPTVDLGDHGVAQLIESNGTWFPKKTVPRPEKIKGSAIVKANRTPTERLVEQGRKRNKGCYFGTVVVMVLIIVGIVFLLRSCIA